MQTMGAAFDGEWESLCKLFSFEESDTTAHLLDYSPPASEQDDSLSFETPSSFAYETNCAVVGNNYYSQASNLNGSNCFPIHKALFGTPCSNNDVPVSNDISLCMDFSMVDGESDGLLALQFLNDMGNEAVSADEGSSTRVTDNLQDNNSAALSSPSTELTLKGKPNSAMLQDEKDEKSGSISPPKKRARVSRCAQKGKRKTQSKKDEMTQTMNGEEEADAAQPGQSFGGDNSDDESNASEETNEAAESESSKAVSFTSTGKKRASRGAATDPQSLYARRRRMRINERLRILQSLVPNGTKVDISTMLEEAFHYVKFLQLQIRLLSSDEHWMFVPLAYNGLDVGAYRRLSPFLGV